jgi:hypothetical protein
MPDSVAGRPRTAKTADASDEMTQTINRSGEALDHIARETLSCCTDTLAAAMNSGSETSHLLSAVTRAYMDACTRSATTVMDLARDGMTCKTPADVLAVQKKGFEATHTMFEASTKLCSDLYDAWSQSLVPVLTRATDVPERMFRAVAD